MQCRELEIPVSWGNIAVKAWGDSTNEAAVVLHGLLDNAGSFDTLIPLLPASFYYICVDLPGHGYSSHFPPSQPLYFIDFIFAVRDVTVHFGRDKYTLIGHSFGGRLAVLFTQIFPRLISKIALLDAGYLLPNTPERYMSSLIHVYDVVKKTNSFKPENTPSYTYEEIVHKIIGSRFLGTLTFETAEQLAKRMIRKVGEDKYEFTYDKRLRAIIYPSFSSDYIRDMFKLYPLKCPAISIYVTMTKKALKTRKRVELYYRLPNFRNYEVNGHHHSHHTNPELFSPILTKFLLRKRNKL